MTMKVKDNSIHCLEDKDKCKPLGGYSILGITPQISHSSQSNDIILVTSKLDTAGFFLDRLIVCLLCFLYLLTCVFRVQIRVFLV